MPITRGYHVEVHKIGLTKFAEKYPTVKKWLIDNDWVFNKTKNKWVNWGNA